MNNFPKRYDYRFIIADKHQLPDGRYLITMNDWEGNPKQSICSSNLARAQELVPESNNPIYLKNIDIYQFSSITIEINEAFKD